MSRASRLFVLVAYALVGLMVWQTSLLEIADDHEDIAAECPDDDAGACDCGENCHCCLECAHHGSPAVSGVLAAAPSRLLDFVEIEPSPPTEALSSADAAPPFKVPKHLA